jgi:hypothetical protein
MSTSFSFLSPSTPDSHDEMEVGHHNEQLPPSMVELEDEDPMDLDNQAQNAASTRTPFGDITARFENASAQARPATPATAPLHAGAMFDWVSQNQKQIRD